MPLDSNLLKQLETLSLRSRRKFLSSRQGGHTSLKRGHGVEFSDYRKYELGDDPRQIDWKVYARNDRLYIKLSQEEQNLSVLLMIDGSASMLIPKTDQKFERAQKLALALGYIALMQQDRVCIAIPGTVETPFVTGIAAIHKLDQLTSKISPKEKNFAVSSVNTIGKITYPGIAIILSDLLMPFYDIQKIFDALRAKNLDLTCIQITGAHELDPFKSSKSFLAQDAETGEQIQISESETSKISYQEVLYQHQKLIRDYCASANIKYCEFLPEENLTDFIGKKLSFVGLVS